MDESAETSSGMTRRTLIKRGAVVGGTLMWAAPVVDSFVSPAFGQVGTPPPGGKGLSYVAFLYDCQDGRGVRSIKFEFDDAGNVTECETGGFAVPGCEVEKGDFTEGANPGDCDHFTVTSPDGGLTIVVTFTGDEEVCNFLASGGSAAVGKCGDPDNPQSGGECVQGTVSGNTITFGLCGD